MSLHTELDVYKTGYDLLTKVTSMVKNMERSFKRLIGEEIVDETKKLLLLVYRANVADDKVPHISMLIERVKLVEMLFRLSWDMKEITDRQYWAVIRLTESIAKQAVKWREWAARRQSHGGSSRHDRAPI
ncbi:four helix bundle protein [Burkholderia aenigmatica]|uniref:Four helix bundle protein n=1 Tax=Burkholderia aenigmatica TaxID=2015348 RepID=A0A228IJT9_9BURK|nr:four helix bundle protein [Burkholderia aenigmatica]OXI42445.1 four helix bundle protein [Burkholderia aenigmatica]